MRKLLVIATVVLAGCGGAASSTSPAGSPTNSASPIVTDAATASPIGLPTDGPVEPGTYGIALSARSVAGYTVTVPEGWATQYGQCCIKHSDAPVEVSFAPFVPDTIYADACQGSDGERMAVGPSVDDLAAALIQQVGPKASDPVDTTLGGYPAKRIDLTIPEGFDLKSCSLEGNGLQIWFSHPSDDYFVLLPDGSASVYVIDVDGQRQVFLTQHRSATSDEDLAELRDILDSIQFKS